MHICDITREDEVVGTVHIITKQGEGDNEQEFFVEVGQRALDAFNAGAWGLLHTLTPAAHRVKDAKKAAAGKKAAASRQANKAAKATTAPTEPAAAPSTGAGGNAAPTPQATSTGAPAAPTATDSGDPGF